MAFQPLKNQALRLHSLRAPTPPHIQTQCRTVVTARATKPVRQSLDNINLHRLETRRRAYYKRRIKYASFGLFFSVCGMYGTIALMEHLHPEITEVRTKMDSGKRDDAMLGRERKVVVQKLGEEPEEVRDVVETGTSSVPSFPRVLDFYDVEGEREKLNEDRLVEYQLLGLGIRTVSFLGIQVYVVGMYIATEDIAAFQQALIRKISPIASTLVAGEKEKLKALLFDPEKSEDIWSSVLKETGSRTLIRIVPCRNTDFGHLRDAWVRQVTNRAALPANAKEYEDDVFGQELQKFKGLLNRGSVPKGKELLLARNEKGRLAMWYDDGKQGAQRLGHVDDERISRAVFLNYLAGKTVASEPARKSIVEGVMEFVERPVGTVATQVQLHV